MQIFGPKPGPDGRPEACRATGSTQKFCLLGVQSWWWWQKIWMISEKNGFQAKKMHFWPKNLHFFYATPIKPPFFRLRRTWLNGSISPPYPEVTLDTSTLMQNITNFDVELIRQPKGQNWPPGPPPPIPRHLTNSTNPSVPNRQCSNI